jgi:hypothetical protein
MPARQARAKATKDEIHRSATEKALDYMVKGAFMGLGSAFLLSKTSSWFARRPRVFKTIYTMTWPIVGFVIGGEHEALRLEREFAYERSYVKVHGIPGMAAEDKEAYEPRFVLDPDARLVTADVVRSYIVENQFKLLFTLWGSLVSATLIWTFSSKTMPMAQKLIYARLVAQGTTLSAFVGLAAMGIQGRNKDTPEDKVNDRHLGQVMGLSPNHLSETNWERAERWCARAKMDYEKCLSDNPARGCAEKEEVLLSCLGPRLAATPFRSWLSCHKTIRSTGMHEGKSDCDGYRESLKGAIELARDR